MPAIETPSIIPPTKRALSLLARLMGMRGRTRTPLTEAMHAMLAAVDAKDSYTRTHSIQVAAYADALAARLGLSADQRSVLRAASLLHDIGKIGIPDRILNKPGRLTEEEFCVMRCHPRMAVNILKPFRGLRRQCEIILHHHERYNGLGYPARLCGEDIPLGARILSAADAIDTMVSQRVYKKPKTAQQVQAELAAQAGVQFDPRVVVVAIRWIDDGGIEDNGLTVSRVHGKRRGQFEFGMENG